MSSQKAIIIDVRTPEEFNAGNAPGSVNIPMDAVQARINEIKQMEGPIILCCASGARSQMVCQYLLSIGMTNVKNGGSWLEVAQTVMNNATIK